MHKIPLPILVLALAGCEDTATVPTPVEPATVNEVIEDNEPTHFDPTSCTWEAEGAALLSLQDSTAVADGGAATVDADTVTLTEGGTWIVSGSLLGHQLVIDTEDAVQLVLDGVDLETAQGPALRVEDADSITIVLAEGSTNTLRDGSTHPADQEAPNAALSSRSDLTICGSGSLAVEGRYRDGIASSDGLVLADGVLDIDASDDGLRGKDYLTISGGTLSVVAGGDGLVSDNVEEAGLGYVLLEGGQIDLVTVGDGISASSDLLVTGSTLDVVAGGGAGAAIGETSTKGLKGLVGVYIEGGDLVVDAADDAIHSDGAVVFADGVATLSTGDDGLHGDASIDITGGVLDIVESYEGLASIWVTISGGVTHIVASDDGISVADGTGIGGLEPGPGTQPGSEELCDCYLSIHGGRLVVDAGGDGLDSNGYGEITGGVVIVNGPPGDDGPPDAALDFGELDISGGLLVATYMGEMANEMEGESTQHYVQVGLGSSRTAGTLVHLEDAAGQNLLTFAPSKPYAALAFSSPELQTGDHSVYVGGSAVGTEVDGLYEDASFSGGALETDFTLTGITVTVGDSGQSGPGGPGGGPP